MVSACVVPTWSLEEQVCWCGGGGALLVSLLVIYSEFKAHFTSMATTAFCSAMPSHQVCSYWDHHLFFNTQWPQTHLQVMWGLFDQEGKWWSAACRMTWPPQLPDLNPIKMVWDQLGRRVKEKQPTSVQHLWEVLQDGWKTIPCDDFMNLLKPRVCKAVIKAKGGYFE